MRMTRREGQNSTHAGEGHFMGISGRFSSPWDMVSDMDMLCLRFIFFGDIYEPWSTKYEAKEKGMGNGYRGAGSRRATKDRPF